MRTQPEGGRLHAKERGPQETCRAPIGPGLPLGFSRWQLRTLAHSFLLRVLIGHLLCARRRVRRNGYNSDPNREKSLHSWNLTF